MPRYANHQVNFNIKRASLYSRGPIGSRSASGASGCLVNSSRYRDIFNSAIM